MPGERPTLGPRDYHSECPTPSKDRGRSLFMSDGVIDFATTHEEIKDAFLAFQEEADQIYPGTTVLEAFWGREREILLDVFAEVVTEIAMTHEEMKGVFSNSQHGADQIYPGWMAYTDEFPVQAASVTSRSRDGHTEHPALRKDRGQSLFRSDGPIDVAMTYGEIKGADLIFQKDADQTLPGWKEKLTCTDEFPVQAARSDRAKQASSAAFVGAGGAPATKEGSVASRALHVDGCGMRSSFPTLAIGNNPGMGDVERGKTYDVATNITVDNFHVLFDRGKSRAGRGHQRRPGDLGELHSQLVAVDVPVPGGLISTSHASKELLDKVGHSESLNDQLAAYSIYEDVDKSTKLEDKCGINESLNDKLAGDPTYEDVDKFMKVGREIRGEIMDNPVQENPEDKVGLYEFLNGQMADDSFYEDVDQFTKVGKEIRGKVMDNPFQERSGDKVGLNEFLNDQLAGDPIYEDVDKLTKVGKEIRGQIVDNPFQGNSGDKAGLNEFLNDQLTGDSIYKDVDKLTKVGKEIRGQIMDNPFQENSEDRLGLNEFLTDQGADDSIHEDVDKFAKVVKEIRGKITDNPFHGNSEDKVGLNEFLNDQLADDFFYEDVDKPTKVGKKIRGKVMDNPFPEHSGDKVGINEFIKDQPADDSVYEDVDKFTKVGKETRGKIVDNPSQENFADHSCINEFIKDQPADLPIYEEVDKFTKVGKEIRDKIMGDPFPENFEMATAAHFAAEPSTGTNVKGLTMDAFTTSLEALVYYIDPDSEEMMIAYPSLLFDRNIFDSPGMMSPFLALAVGHNQGMGDVQCGKIYDLYMPPEFLRLYDAPVVNLEDVWRIMGKGTLNGGLGAGATIKPKLGLQPKPLGEACCAYWPVGDFITNDGLQGRQVFCQMNACIPEVVTDTRVTIKETGNGKLFVVNSAIGMHPETFLTYDTMDAYTKVVQAMGSAIRETGNGKRFSANTTADDPNELITHGNYQLSQFGSLLENCALLAYPNRLFDQFDYIFDGHGMLPSFPTWTVGTYQGTSETEYGRIYDLYMPLAFLRLYDGPAANVDDMRHILGKGMQNGGPREGAIIQLKPGLQPKSFGGGCYAFWPVGDFVMNDEQQGHPVFCQCIPEVVEDMGAATRETGHGTPLSTNITADVPNEMTARGKYCLFQSQFGPFMAGGMNVLSLPSFSENLGHSNEILTTRGAAAHFAAESSMGTNANVCTMVDSPVDALVYYIDPDSEEMTIAYPHLLFYRSFIDGLGVTCSFLTLASDNNQGMGDAEYGKIFSLRPAFLCLYDGPAVNVEDMRRILGKGAQNGGFVAGTIIKTKLGLQPKPFGEAYYAFCQGGDFSKNDEPWSSLSQFGPLLKNCTFLVDGYVTGGTAETCARRNFPQQFLHCRRAGHGSVTNTRAQRGHTAFVHTQTSQVTDASGIHSGTIGSGKMEGDMPDKIFAFTLQDDETDGPYYRQEWEGMKLTT